MNTALHSYIESARRKGHKDERIKADMVEAGWDPGMVEVALSGGGELQVPPPPPAYAPAVPARQPQAVVQNFTTRGLEYIIMFIALAVSALSLGSVLHSNVNTLLGGDTSIDNYFASYAIAALVVGLPVFAGLFLRLQRAEHRDASLHNDPSRKHAVQLTLVITFLVGLGNIIFFVYSLMSGSNNATDFNILGSSAATGPLGNFIHLLITLVIAGGIFAYYWHDEHRRGNN
ncbi:MAG: hypothetical protein JWN01_434 [Patescibacteria group bacterium]|nr:hypothetical protein [Patescibacteria group bacterium]